MWFIASSNRSGSACRLAQKAGVYGYIPETAGFLPAHLPIKTGNPPLGTNLIRFWLGAQDACGPNVASIAVHARFEVGLRRISVPKHNAARNSFDGLRRQPARPDSRDVALKPACAFPQNSQSASNRQFSK